jgi:aminopeptidase N
MSLSGITASSFFGLIHGLQGKGVQLQKVQSDFQQLGQDLQSGNLTQAQSDFSILSQNFSSSTQSSSPLTQTLSALGQALQTGNLSAAQQAYSTIQQDVQQAAAYGHPHHHHHLTGSASAASNSSNPLAQAFSTLGQALQSGNLSAAQTAYKTIQQDLTELGWNAASTSQLTAGAVSLSG